MPFSAGLRKFALTTHVTSSLGWFGAVATFLTLSVAGVTGEDPQLVRAVYLAMHLITWLVIVPFSLASLATGVAQSLGTQWGLFRHYWIAAKLGLTVIATLILLAHTQPIAQVAQFASDDVFTQATLRDIRIRLIADAGAAVVALLIATTLSVYKPWGMTSYGRRAVARGTSTAPREASPWRWLWIAGVVAALVTFLALHLAGGRAASH